MSDHQTLMANSSIIKTMSESNRRWKIPSRFPTELISSSRTSIRRGSAITRLKLTHLRLLRAAYTGIWNHLTLDCCRLNFKCKENHHILKTSFCVSSKRSSLPYDVPSKIQHPFHSAQLTGLLIFVICNVIVIKQRASLQTIPLFCLDDIMW